MKKLNCILLVDDNESDNFIHKRILEKAGIAVHIEIAINGREALDFIFSKRIWGQPEGYSSQPELIFLDINMPVMDGWEFLEAYQQRKDVKNGKAVIILLTTSLNPADRSRAEMIIGYDCFQSKPLTLKMISDIMLKHFPDFEQR